MPDEILDDWQFEDYLFLNEDDDNTVVAEYYSALEGEVAAARLRSEGIPCFLANALVQQSVLTHLPIYTRLHIRPSDKQKAIEILGEAALDTSDLPINPPAIKWQIILGIALAIVLGVTLARLLISLL